MLLAVLMMLLPIVLRLLARFEGIPKYTGLELSLMTRFFIFQVVVSVQILLHRKHFKTDNIVDIALLFYYDPFVWNRRLVARYNQ